MVERLDEPRSTLRATLQRDPLDSNTRTENPLKTRACETDFDRIPTLVNIVAGNLPKTAEDQEWLQTEMTYWYVAMVIWAVIAGLTILFCLPGVHPFLAIVLAVIAGVVGAGET